MPGNEIPAFPNPGVRLIKEDAHVAVWEEIFEPRVPTAPHRHTRDYIAICPNAGEVTVQPLAGELEVYTTIAGHVEALPTETGKMRASLTAGTILHSQVPADGASHFAVNEGQQPVLMILIELKGTATEKKRE
jgi:hypothetical protein